VSDEERSPIEEDATVVSDWGGMSKYGRGAILAAALLLLVLTLFVAIALPAPTVNQENAAAMLTLITAGAVGIERAIEVLWTVVGANGQPWWPFTAVGDRVKDLLHALNANLGPLRDKASGVVESMEADAKKVEEFPNLRQADWLFSSLGKLGPSNRRARDLAKAASISAQWFEDTHAEQNIKDAAERVQFTAKALTNFLDTFNDNPARRLISILLGCIIGVIGAGALGLDALQATLGTTPPVDVGIFHNTGTAITGVVIGLGANPTHELIKTLQETKQSRRTA
jgi:hypothetical protein